MRSAASSEARRSMREAEPLYLRALAIREAALGPDSSELLSTLDSLAYVYFGQQKFAEAEPVYRRLLALWESSAGPDHPMVALTLDKMAEFYAFQQRYTEAEAAASQSLALRTNQYIASLNQTGRILIMEAKIAEAEDLYRRSIQIADLAKASDAALDPLLRIEARILRDTDHPPGGGCPRQTSQGRSDPQSGPRRPPSVAG